MRHRQRSGQQASSSPAFATAILVQGGNFAGGISNTGNISAQVSGSKSRLAGERHRAQCRGSRRTQIPAATSPAGFGSSRKHLGECEREFPDSGRDWPRGPDRRARRRPGDRLGQCAMSMCSTWPAGAVLAPAQSILGFGTLNLTGGTLVLGVTTSNAPGSFRDRLGRHHQPARRRLATRPARQPLPLRHDPDDVPEHHHGDERDQLGASLQSPRRPRSRSKAHARRDDAERARRTVSAEQDEPRGERTGPDPGFRLGLDAPQVLTQAVQDRLVASGGVLTDGRRTPRLRGAARGAQPRSENWISGRAAMTSSAAPRARAQVTCKSRRPAHRRLRCASATASYVGLAGTYVESTASFKDGSHTTESSYQGAAYAGWAGGPWYALGSGVVSINNFATTRQLASFGSPAPYPDPHGAKLSRPCGGGLSLALACGPCWPEPQGGVTPPPPWTM